MPAIFQPAAWLFLGAGVIMFLAALRYQGRVWWPFRGRRVGAAEGEDVAPSRWRRWVHRLRPRRLRRARRAEDLARAEASQRRRQMLERLRQGLSLTRAAQGVALIATLLALGSALQLPTDVTTVPLWSWEPVNGMRVGLTYRVDDLARWLVQVMLAIAFLALAARGGPRTGDYAWGLAALGAFVHLVFCLDLIAFLVGWTLLDVALFALLAGATREEDARSLVANLAASLVVTVALLGAILTVGRSDGALLFPQASPILLENRALGLFLLAAVFRLGLYPFHLRLRYAAAGSPAVAALGHLLPLLAGFYLLARLYALASGEMPGLAGVQTLGLLSLVAGATLIWRTREPRAQVSYAFLSQVGGLTVVLTFGAPEAIAATLVGLVSLALATVALFVQADELRLGQPAGRTERWIQYALLALPLASVAGAPPLLGFWGRWMGYNVLLEQNQPGVFLLALGCHVSVLMVLLRTLDRRMRPEATLTPDPLSSLENNLLFAADRQIRRRAAGSGDPAGAVSRGICWGAAALLSLPLVILGFWPPATLDAWRPIVALAAGVPVPTLSPTGLSAAPADTLTPWFTLGGLLLSLAVALGLSSWRHRPRVVGPPARLYDALDLAWAYRLGWGVMTRWNEWLAGLFRALDGDYALAWVILLGLVVGLFLLGGGALP